MHGKRVVAFFLALVPVLLHAGEIASYSMIQESTGPGGGQKAVTKWFVTPSMSRTEMAPDSTHPAGSIVVISRRDKGLTWTLFPAKKAYMEQVLEEGELRRLGESFTSNLKVEELGSEQVLGHDCKKQRVRGEVAVGSRTVKSVQKVWQCAAFDVPLRIDGEDGSRTRTTELKVGPQPGALFEVPRGYKKAENLMDVMRAGKGR